MKYLLILLVMLAGCEAKRASNTFDEMNQVLSAQKHCLDKGGEFREVSITRYRLSNYTEYRCKIKDLDLRIDPRDFKGETK